LQYSRPLTGQPGASSKGAASASVDRESVLLEPVTDARGTPIDGAPDLAERCSGLHQRPELLLRKVTLVRVLTLIHGLDAVLLQVVAGGRGVAPHALTDLLEAQSLRQTPLQKLFRHLQAFSALGQMDWAPKCADMQGKCGGRRAGVCRMCEGPGGRRRSRR